MNSLHARYRKAARVALVLMYLVILAGGIVRATGSGMGCPDWPKCFGRWVPPTSEAELPKTWKADFAKEHSCKGEAVFNAAQTWTEYLNRLMGVLAGFAVAGFVLVALPFRKIPGQRWRLWLAFAVLLATLFQAWLGSVVVRLCLKEGMVTTHMLFALVLIGLLLVAVQRPGRTGFRRLRFWALTLLGAVTVQILLGTQVREAIDATGATTNLAETLGGVFLVHRSFSWAIVLLAVVLALQLWRQNEKSLATGGLALVLLALTAGLGLAYLGMPPFLQPVHLLVGALLFGWSMHVALRTFAVPART